MQEYVEMFNNLDAYDKVYWSCAIIGTAIFAIQTILMMIGMDSPDMDVDVDFDDGGTMDLGGAISLFSIKNFINFIVGFGWAGVCLGDVIESQVWLAVAAVLTGIAFVLMFFLIKKQTKKLEHNGAFRIGDCKGKTADVYLRIPAARSGKGKVQVSLNGTVLELDAVTDGDEISSGSKVKVIDVAANTLVVQ